MKLFDVYPLYPINITNAKGAFVYDENNTAYLDLYGGHAVISIGHGHPHYIKRIEEQLHKIGFYSNSVHLPIQEELAVLLGKVSGHSDYQLFLCNSGAEANENAMKLASFVTGRKKIVAFSKSFHGRTSLAVAATDNKSIVAPVNETDHVIFTPFNNIESLQSVFKQHGNGIAAVIIEGIQGVGGIYEASVEFLQQIRTLCDTYGAVYIADSVQCGYGRSGQFFAHDYAGVYADVYTMAKGMGNGFPVAGIAIAPHIQAKHGMLGTTFGGNPLACAASLAVLEVMEKEKVMEHSMAMGQYVMHSLKNTNGITEIRGRGLMIGIELDRPAEDIRKKLLFDHQMFLGSASNKQTIRLLPALNIEKIHIDAFIGTLKNILN